MNKRQLTFLLGILVLMMMMMMMMIVLPARADEGIQVSLTPSTSELTVGDPVQFTLEVNHPAGYQVIIPKLEQVWGSLEVRSQSQAVMTANEDGTETTSQTIEATLFNLGEVQTPELVLTLSDGVGGLTEAVVSAAALTVVPTLAEDDNELRDIKPQAGLQVPSPLAWIAGGLLLAGLVAIVGWWAYRRWQGKPFGLAPAVDNRPAWQVAFDELDRVAGLGLLEQGRFKEYYTLMTDALRTYLESQFQMSVHERTTFELKAIFRRSDLEPEHSRRFLDLFGESDLVKFAKFTPDVPSASQALDEARQLVDLTRPKVESDMEAFFSEDAPSASGQGGKRPRVGTAPAGVWEKIT